MSKYVVVEKHLLGESRSVFKKKKRAMAFAKKLRSGFSFAGAFRGIRVRKIK